MLITVTESLTITVSQVDTVKFGDTAAKNRETIINGLNITTNTLNANSTPPVTLDVPLTKAMVAGAATIDFRDLLDAHGVAADANGLKLQRVVFSNPTTNANSITIAVGTANGYTALGAGFSVTLSPGDKIAAFRRDTAPDVDGTHKNIDLAGTGTQALDLLLIFG